MQVSVFLCSIVSQQLLQKCDNIGIVNWRDKFTNGNIYKLEINTHTHTRHRQTHTTHTHTHTHRQRERDTHTHTHTHTHTQTDTHKHTHTHTHRDRHTRHTHDTHTHTQTNTELQPCVTASSSLPDTPVLKSNYCAIKYKYLYKHIRFHATNQCTC